MPKGEISLIPAPHIEDSISPEPVAADESSPLTSTSVVRTESNPRISTAESWQKSIIQGILTKRPSKGRGQGDLKRTVSLSEKSIGNADIEMIHDAKAKVPLTAPAAFGGEFKEDTGRWKHDGWEELEREAKDHQEHGTRPAHTIKQLAKWPTRGPAGGRKLSSGRCERTLESEGPVQNIIVTSDEIGRSIQISRDDSDKYQRPPLGPCSSLQDEPTGVFSFSSSGMMIQSSGDATRMNDLKSLVLQPPTDTLAVKNPKPLTFIPPADVNLIVSDRWSSLNPSYIQPIPCDGRGEPMQQHNNRHQDWEKPKEGNWRSRKSSHNCYTAL